MVENHTFLRSISQLILYCIAFEIFRTCSLPMMKWSFFVGGGALVKWLLQKLRKYDFGLLVRGSWWNDIGVTKKYEKDTNLFRKEKSPNR